MALMPMPTLVMVPAAMPRSVGAAFGLEGQVLRLHDEVHRPQHVGQHVVGFDLEVVGLQLDRHVAVAQVVGGAGQVEGGAVLRAVRDDQDGLRRSDDADHGAVFGHQHVTAAHQGAAWQEDAQLAPGGVSGGKAAFLAHFPVQFDGAGALDQHGGQAFALGDEFGGLDHGDVLLQRASAHCGPGAHRGCVPAIYSARVMKKLYGSGP